MNTLNNRRFTMKSSFYLTAVLLAAMIFNGCFSGNRFSSANSKNQDSGRASDSADEPNNTDASSKTADEARPLEAKWYEDANENAVPDFIETEIGKDPHERDHCPVDSSKCGGAGEGGDIDLNVNTLLMLDASGSMKAQSGGGVSKLDAAKQALTRYVERAPKPVKMGFLVYGHKGNNTPAGKPESCADAGAELLDDIGNVSKDTFQSTLDKFQPTGWTPIAVALKRAGQSFAGMEGKNNHIVMVSDGLETCGGNPVAVARELHEEGVRVTIDIVGFGAGAADVQQLRQIAEAGGGDYFDAKTVSDLNDYLTKQMEASTKTLESGNCFHMAYLDADSCDKQFIIDATGIINRLNQENFDDYFVKNKQNPSFYNGYIARRDAYSDIITRMNEKRLERREARAGTKKQADELYEKSRRLDEQFQDNYNKNK